MGSASELPKIKMRTGLAFFENVPDLAVSSLKMDCNFVRKANEVYPKLNTIIF